MRDPIEDFNDACYWEAMRSTKKPGSARISNPSLPARKGFTPQKIRIAFECKQADRYQQAYEAIRNIMFNTAIPRNKKIRSIAMMIDAAESGMKRNEKKQ